MFGREHRAFQPEYCDTAPRSFNSAQELREHYRQLKRPKLPRRPQLLLLTAPPPPEPQLPVPFDPASIVGRHTETILTLDDYEAPDPLSLAQILCAVSKVTKIPVLEIKAHRRSLPYIKARFLYYAIAAVYSSAPYTVIGKQCGGRDHSTVMNGLGKAAKEYDAHRKLLEEACNLLDRRVPQPEQLRRIYDGKKHAFTIREAT
jgi:hypothetical protein